MDRGLFVERGDGKLEHGRKRYPEKIRDIGVDDPAHVGVYVPKSGQRPHERPQDKENIRRRHKIVLEPKLYRREREIEQQIERKRQSNDPREPSRKCPIKHRAK